MQDRVPLYPGRVKMTPVAGQANTYDMVRADQPTQQGTPINKASMLKDVTAALFGLGTDAVPDDVTAWLGKYAQYWWRKRIPSETKYVEKQNDVTAEDEISGIRSYGTTVWVSKTIHFDPTTGGDITLVNSEAVALDSWNSVDTGIVQVSKITAKAPCYLKVSNTASAKTYYLPAGSTVTKFTGGNGTLRVRYQSSYKDVYFGRSSDVPVKAKVVTNGLGTIPAGDWQYLRSSNRNAYPDSGTQNGYEYEYLGVPFQNIVSAPKIATGIYIGTGVYGANNPSTLVFDFVPKAVIISKKLSSESDDLLVYVGQPGQAATGSGNAFSCIGTTLSWYSQVDAIRQWNSNGATYYYVAFG